MRRLPYVFVFIMAISTPFAMAQAPGKSAYRIDFDSDSDVELLPHHPATGEKGIFYRVKFTIRQTEDTNEDVRKTYKIIIKEDGAEVGRIDVPPPRRTEKIEKVTSVLALDKSGSMLLPADDTDKDRKIDALKEAAMRFVDKMGNRGRTTVLDFSDAVSVPGEFTSDPRQLKPQIDSLQAKGETAFLDAAYTAIMTLEAENPDGKRAVIVLTDGVDNSSRRRVEEVIQAAQRAKIPLHMLGFGRDHEIDAAVMQRMADQTDGKYFRAKNEKALLEVFETVAIELHRVEKSEEAVYKSLRQVKDGTRRTISLELLQSGAVVQTQEGKKQLHGLVVPEMSPFWYLAILGGIGALLVIPAGMRSMFKGKAAV